MNNKHEIKLDCISIEKSAKLIEVEKKTNYLLKQIFFTVYWKLDELCSIIYLITFNQDNQNISLRDKLNIIIKEHLIKLNNSDRILFEEVMSLTNYFKTWKDISFPMTIKKLHEFINSINQLYLSLKKELCLFNFVDRIKMIYNKIYYI